ncbi:cell division protein FtsZ [Salipiger sp. IMCC34102]|uniref:cell division protein FtsZ n=1 Tax=Salipiger sp. IMCC34102 TaxID=2510647 RepID=UPI00101D8C1C|nr:cell division protein FtsZ [Salipiger sp. IMCC34102]RYH02689.1 cell division protein FtsZ [Salipiger sp. IMCC34102]
MTLNLSLPGHEELKPRITVFGVGGAGGNAVNNMIEKELDGVEFVVANTDAQALQQSKSDQRIQMGLKVTEGLGAGARATVGAAAAEESIEQIVDQLAGAHMCFITAGMGGGTGTGAAPIIAQAARELGVLTVGVVTKPFQFEGGRRMRQAEEGVEALQKVVDTLIIIPNQNLFRLATENTTFTEAFALADDVLYQGVKGVTDLMVRPGLINLDFADVRSVMDEMGKAMMGTGEAEGEDRAKQAAQKAIANPLLDEISLHGAKGVLINITGGYDLTLFELDEAANEIRDKVHEDANIIVGSTLDTEMEGRMRVSVVATGIDAAAREEAAPQPRRSVAEPIREPRREEPRQEEVRREEPRRREVPAARAPEPAPQPHREEPRREAPAARAPEPEAPRERSLLDDMDDRHQAPAARDEDDDLPPPAYQPRQEPEPRASESFTAPRAARPGEPTPEALARLQAAVQRQPKGATEARRAPEPEAEKGRFGINSLIGRMTGEQKPAPAAPRQQPQVSAQRDQASARPRVEDDVDPDQERIEIPAFLRRQAN